MLVGDVRGFGYGRRHGTHYELTGREALTRREQVAAIAAGAGLDIRFEEITQAQARQEMIEQGMVAEVVDEMILWYPENYATLTPTALRRAGDRASGKDVGPVGRRPHRGFSTGGSLTAQEEITDSPTGWVNEHVRQYVESGGTKGTRFYGHAALLITTRGRKTGKLRRTALYYGTDRDHYVLVASNGGSRTHPAWYLNLTANPEVNVQVGAERFTARARTVTGDERPALWELMVKTFRTYASYQAKVKRELPVVVLERVTG